MKISLQQHEKIQWPNATTLAQILCKIERKYAKHVDPEEFVQCSGNLIKEPMNFDKPSTSGAAPGIQDPKKTCNLESYFEWSARLRLLVANEILQVSNYASFHNYQTIKCFFSFFLFKLIFQRQNVCDRNNKVELWSGAAQYCLLVGNYNSATAILESMDSPPIARLQTTVSHFFSAIQKNFFCFKKFFLGGRQFLER